MIRAVVDVNVLISSILGPLGHSRQVLTAWGDGRFIAISSAGIIGQLEEKLSLPRIVRRYHVDGPADIRWIQGLLSSQAELVLVPTHERRTVTGDPEDDYVLATVRLAQADYLITGDHGLLALGEHHVTRIVTPRAFLALVEEDKGRTTQ